MSHRPGIKASAIKPNPGQRRGMLNAEKCVAYLRGIGVEVDDATADGWLDAQAAYRFLKSERRVVRRVQAWFCSCGAMEGFTDTGPGRWRERDKQKRKEDEVEEQTIHICDKCQTGFCNSSLLFTVARDGTVIDYRRETGWKEPIKLDEFAGGL